MRRSSIAFAVLHCLAPVVLLAGGPKWVAGNSYFDPAIVGQPIRWAMAS